LGIYLIALYLWSFYLQYYDIVNGFGYWFYLLPATFLWLASWSASVHMALVFPAPLYLVQRKPGLIWIPYLSTFILFSVGIGISRLVVSNSLTRIALWWRGEFVAAIVIFIPTLLLMIAQYARFRHAPERAKIKWVVFSAVICGSLTVVLYLVPLFLGLLRIRSQYRGYINPAFPAAIASPSGATAL
jgi:hypothetical protein